MRQRVVKLGRVAGIEVGANWSVLVILVLIADVLAVTVLPTEGPGHGFAVYWAVAVAAALLFLASLLAHELAHAIVARRNQVPVGSITLWMLGGMAELKSDPASPRAELRIAVAGPLTSLAAAAVFLLAAAGGAALGGGALIISPLAWIGVMNAFLAAFNLLPGAPLDGGRVLRALLWRWYGDRARASRAAARTGQVLGYLIIGVGAAEILLLEQFGGLWLMFVGWFISAAASAEELTRRTRAAATDMWVGDIMTPVPECGAGWTRVDVFVAQVALLSRQTLFPVVDVHGEPVGYVTLDVLARVPAGQAAARLDEVALPLPRQYVAAPGDPALPLLDRRALPGGLVAVVTADGRVCGMVIVADLRRLIRQSAFPPHQPRVRLMAAHTRNRAATSAFRRVG